MGALIQTKGTQRLAKLFNDRFDAGSIAGTRRASTATRSLAAAFQDPTANLLKISDEFIAQNNVSGPGAYPDANDVLYPSATMVAAAASATNTITFNLPFAGAMIPPLVAVGNSLCIFEGRPGPIPRDTLVTSIAPSANSFMVTLNQNVNVAINTRISFAKPKHKRLVRRWRWYLKNDLKPENHETMRRAISAALDDDDFKRVVFQTVEDTQKVLIDTRRKFNNGTEELDDELHMYVILLTQSTTAPDKLDDQ